MEPKSRKGFCKRDWLSVRETFRSSESALLDLRSEKEYDLGHIPGSFNVPLLSNQERHEVGKAYKEQGKTQAVQMGLEIFAHKQEAFLGKVESLCSSQKEVVLYCWRGGLRSQMVGAWLGLLGFSVSLIQGGYKSYRHWALEELEALSRHPLIVLNGKTGAGKTQILQWLQSDSRIGAIDFEGLACHRGSAFGALGQDASCPTQQNFENQLVECFQEQKHHSHIVVELEGAIGPVVLPSYLRKAMRQAKMVMVERDLKDRVEHLVELYTKSWGPDREKEFLDRLEWLSKFISQKDKQEIRQSLQGKHFHQVTRKLLELRYDRVYEKSLRKHALQTVKTLNLSKLKKDEAISELRQLVG